MGKTMEGEEAKLHRPRGPSPAARIAWRGARCAASEWSSRPVLVTWRLSSYVALFILVVDDETVASSEDGPSAG